MARKKSAAKKAREEAEKLQQIEPKEQVEKKVAEQVEEEFDSDEESSDSEIEDDFGELITEDVEKGVENVLQAIRTGDKSLFDPKVKFFKELEDSQSQSDNKKEKPIYLKDYHRMNLLSGDALKENEELDEEDFKTYDQIKKEERDDLLSEIKTAFDEAASDEEDGDDGFLKKKENKQDEQSERVRLLPNPNVDEENFLAEFANQHAWIPKEGDKVINLDRKGEEDDEEFDAAAEKFEHAYNFRYEDPNSAEIISYARNQATVRRNDTSGRRKQRELQKEEVKLAKEEKEKQLTKKKNEKVNKLADILEQIKNDFGAEINDDLVKKISKSLLKKDFDDSQWDSLLQEIFNDDFYNDTTVKPEWGDDDEIMKDFKPGQDDDEEEEDEEQPQENQDKEEEEEEADDSEEPPKKKTKKDELKEKKDKKKEKKRLKELAEKAVEANKLQLIDEIEEEREGRSKEKKETFKYREVSPETFGLTTREILIADDTQLNEFVGLKKYAAYRPKDQRVKDRRKLAKSKQLKEWRKKVFKSEDGPKVEEGDDGNDIKIPVEHKKKHKHHDSKKRKHNA